MGTPRAELIGKTFGELTVIADTAPRYSIGGHRRRFVVCKCSCGSVREYAAATLTVRKLAVRSCGGVGGHPKIRRRSWAATLTAREIFREVRAHAVEVHPL